MTTLKKGSKGDLVRAVQYILGASDSQATGKYNALTLKAVKRYKKRHKLPQTGTIGSGMWAALLDEAPTLRVGDTGKHVKALEVLLGLTPDGGYQEAERARVTTYQAAQGLTVDGVVGRDTWRALLGLGGSASTTDPAPATPGKRPKDYKQYDKRWGSKPYTATGNKGQTMKSSGCGPTAMANIVATFGDPNITPYDLAKLALGWGCRTTNSGTAWSFFGKVAKHYDCISKFVQTGSHATAIAALAQGALVVASMGPGYWTKGGHFITLWKCDGARMYACDPASGSRKSQALSAFKGQVKQYFIFWP